MLYGRPRTRPSAPKKGKDMDSKATKTVTAPKIGTCESYAWKARQEHITRYGENIDALKEADLAYAQKYNEAFLEGIPTAAQIGSVYWNEEDRQLYTHTGIEWAPVMTTTTGAAINYLGSSSTHRPHKDNIEMTFKLDFEKKEKKHNYKKYTLCYNKYKKPEVEGNKNY